MAMEFPNKLYMPTMWKYISINTKKPGDAHAVFSPDGYMNGIKYIAT